jgi:hypothetical protein
VPRSHDRLADRDSGVVDQIQIVAILDRPAGRLELPVDEHARALLSGEPALHLVHGRVSLEPIRLVSPLDDCLSPGSGLPRGLR